MRVRTVFFSTFVTFFWPGIAVSETRQTPDEICRSYTEKVADAATSDDRMELVNDLVHESDESQIEHQDFEGAIALLECRLALIEDYPETFDGVPSAAITQDIAGDTYSFEGRFDEAAERYQLAIAGFDAIFGVGDMEGFASTSRMKRALVLVDAGRHDEAEAQMKSTIAFMVKAYGADSEMTDLARKQLEQYEASRQPK